VKPVEREEYGALEITEIPRKCIGHHLKDIVIETGKKQKRNIKSFSKKELKHAYENHMRAPLEI
jgi:hypothetical protein